MNPLELYEAYSAVYAPQEVDEEQLDEISDRKVNAVGRARQANVDKSMSSNEYISDAPGSTQKLATNISKMNRFKHLKKQRDQRKEEFDIFDVVLEFLYVEGYAETLEEAEWMMANIIDEEAIAIVLGEAITSEKGKAKAAEMIAARSTPSGRAKSGQGANVAQIKHIRRSNRDGLGGTPPNRKVAGSNWPKSYTGIGGRGNKAARRAGTYKEEFELWVNELVEEGYDLSDYTWDDMLDIYEADSLAAMQARREKRQKANMKKHGTPGFDYSKPPSGKKGYLDAITKNEEYVDEAITSEKGKAKAAEMIAARSTPSGRAKSGQGANVAQIKHIGRANVDGKFNTPPNEKVAKNPVKSTAYLRGSGNKAARRAGTYKEEFELWVNELVEEGYDLSDYTWDDMFDIYEDSRRMSNKQHAERVRRNISSFGKSKSVEYTPPKNWDPEANRGQGAVLSHKQVEKQRRKSLRQEEYVDESQHARENPEKYEREQAKKSAPVRGERTPMPPRGDKRREDFEKWYAKNVR
jgi:hypothetical protein